ncbi:MAG: transcriptional regulator, partial [Betaproteobacteria bacterium]|nr:transcriptional regulator [Betaproteobacteria bacterium]
HTSVLDGPMWDQMKDWNPAVPDQPDDLLDAGAGSVTDQPTKIGSETVRNEDALRPDDWRPSSGVFEATLEF